MGEGLDLGLAGREGGARQTHSRAGGAGIEWALGRCPKAQDCRQKEVGLFVLKPDLSSSCPPQPNGPQEGVGDGQAVPSQGIISTSIPPTL